MNPIQISVFTFMLCSLLNNSPLHAMQQTDPENIPLMQQQIDRVQFGQKIKWVSRIVWIAYWIGMGCMTWSAIDSFITGNHDLKSLFTQLSLGGTISLLHCGPIGTLDDLQRKYPDLFKRIE